MGVIKWSEIMSVGVEEFDTQHKKLFSLLDELHVSIRSGRTAEKIAEILGELKDYTVYHFEAEEAAFRKYDYPQTEQHVNTHEHLTKGVERLIREQREQKTDVALETLDFLTTWLVDHVLHTDKDYSAFLISKGLS